MASTLVMTKPFEPNGKGIIAVVSAAFHSHANMLNHFSRRTSPLIDAGYTVFLTFHSSTPRFAIPEAASDIKRAVQFVRYNAEKYGIDPDHIGIYGESSGGNLALIVSTSDDIMNPNARDPIKKTSSKVQAVAVLFPATDFMNFGATGNNFVNNKPFLDKHKLLGAFQFKEWDSLHQVYKEIKDQPKIDSIAKTISPAQHVTTDDAPTYIVHGDKDFIVPIQQSELIKEKLLAKNVPVVLKVITGAGHGGKDFSMETKDFVWWFDKYLKIASSLSAVITPDEKESIDKIPASDIAAYDLYIRANHERLLYLGTREDKHLQSAYDLFDKALEIDPNYLLAVIGKGQAFNAEFKTDSALIYANRAIALDPEFNRAYGLKGYCYSITGKTDLAMEYFLKAINLPPKDDWWYHYHTAIGQEFLTVENDVIKALPYFKKGIEKEENQYVGAGYVSLAFAYLNIGDYERAEQYLSKPGCWAIYGYSRLMNVQGKFQEVLQFADSRCQKIECKLYCSLVLFEASLLLGEFEKAEQYFYQYQDTRQESWLITSRYWDYQIGYIYHKLGRTEEAEKTFTEQIQKLQTWQNKGLPFEGRWISYLHLARIYAFQGHRNKALKHLSKYAELGFTAGWHDFILIDPFFESLKDDPQFKAIVKQAQDEKAAIRVQVREMEERGELTL